MSDESRGSRGGFGAVFVLLIFVGAIVKFWIWILVIIGVIVAGAAVGWLLYRAGQRRLDALGRLAAIARRAEEQHAQILAGDSRGMYGIYPPEDPPAPPPTVVERLPRAGANWSEYLAEQRRKALAT